MGFAAAIRAWDEERDERSELAACRLGVPHASQVYRGVVGKTIQIRDVPDDVHATLRARAAAAGISLSEYLLRELENVAERPQISDLLRRVGVRSGGASVDDIVAVVRSARDRGAS